MNENKQDNVQANSKSVNAVCFKHNSNLCSCAVSALILLPVVYMSGKMDSATSI